MPRRQQKRRRLYTHEGSCIRLRPQWQNHVWSYDFVADRLDNGQAIRLLTVMDDYTRECLAIKVNKRLNASHVLDVLSDLFILKGTSQYIRSDNGKAFKSSALQD